MKMNLGRVFTDEEAEMVFGAYLEMNADEGAAGAYKVYSDTGEYVGMGSLCPNEELGAVEIEYMLLPRCWRRGYGTELVGELLKLASRSGLCKAAAITDPENIPSQKVLLKNGFEFVKQFANPEGESVRLYQRTL